jgi:hypothetical protein
MNIQPNKLTIAQLFATPNEQFVVPSYQRRYAWGYNQYLAFYEDIAMLKENDGHLFGMMILHSNLHSGGINQPELVDGQQRMTTLVLLLKAFETVYREKSKDDKANDIQKMILCKDLDDIKRPKIILGDLDNDDIEQLIINDQIDNIKNDKIKNAFLDYKKWLTELDLENINKLFYKLTNIAVIIRLDVGMAQDAYKLFETINNRGLKLTATDIIKNFLLGHAAKINKDQTLENVKVLWSNIIKALDTLDSDDFLRQFMCSILHRRISTSKQLVPEFKKYYMKHIENAELLGEYEYYQNADDVSSSEDDEDDNLAESGDIEVQEENNSPRISIVEFLKKLEALSIAYKKISLATHEKQKINRRIKNLNNILSKPAYIFLMHFLNEGKYDDKEKIAVLKYIETLMLRRHVCEKRTNENDDIFSKMVPLILEDNILEEIKTFITENGYMPNDNEFMVMLPKHQLKGKLIDRAKYILECIEYYKRGNTDELIVSSSDEVHLEHIIPQTINTKRSKEEFGDWEIYLGDKSLAKHKTYVNFIGNMTLLGESLNIQAYNNPFAKKKNSYKKSSFLITKELANQHNFKFNHVDKRGEQLTKLALEIWEV